MNRQPHYSQVAHYERVELEGKIVRVPEPATIPNPVLVARDDLINRALAAWLQLDGLAPLNFRLYGPPGVREERLWSINWPKSWKSLFISSTATRSWGRKISPVRPR